MSDRRRSQASSDYAGAASLFQQLMPGLDLYMLDFRGTGGGAFLDCVDEIARDDFAGCAAKLQADWGERLSDFTVHASARDLGELIGALRPAEGPVMIYAASFGTYWANRYLELYPDQSDAVVLEGLSGPGRCDYSVFQDAASNDLARTFFELCGADATCNDKLGGDPWGFVGALHARVAMGGHCPQLEADNGSLREYILLALFHPQGRDFLPAVLYRYARCDAADVAAVEHYNGRAFSRTAGRNALGEWSTALRLHVAISEMLPDPPPAVEDVEALHSTLYAAGGESILFADLAATWPRYPRAAVSGAFAQTSVPMLMMNGTLDPGTTIAVAADFEQAFDGPHQHYVPLANLSHGVLLDGCAQDLVRAFAADPTGLLDTSCAAGRPSPSFDPSPQRSMVWLGTSDAWEN